MAHYERVERARQRGYDVENVIVEDKLNGVSFRRQHSVGNYIVDFVSVKKKLIIELDGSQHLEQAEYDIERTRYFESQGYKVIRFWNNQVENDTPALACDLLGKSCKCCGCGPRE